MSGDVQPRKRKKELKKKKDSEAEIFARHLNTREDEAVSGVKSLDRDDVQMHIQKDSGTGGHWCAKIVFFLLLAVLAGLVGLILLENRGRSDLDTPLSESRYAEILDGWVQEEREIFEDTSAALDELDSHDHDSEAFDEEPDLEDDGDSDADEVDQETGEETQSNEDDTESPNADNEDEENTTELLDNEDESSPSKEASTTHYGTSESVDKDDEIDSEEDNDHEVPFDELDGSDNEQETSKSHDDDGGDESGETLEDVILDNDEGEEEHLRKLASKTDQDPASDANTEAEDDLDKSASRDSATEQRVSYSNTTQFLEDIGKSGDTLPELSCDEEIEKLDLKRRFTIVTSETYSGEEDEELDISYENELIYDDQEDVDVQNEAYEVYNGEVEYFEDVRKQAPLIEQAIPTPHIIEKPKHEQKLTTVVAPTPTRTEQLGSKVTSQDMINEISLLPLRNTSNYNPQPLEIIEQEHEKEMSREPPQMDYISDEGDEQSEEELYSESASDVDDDDLMRRLEAKYGKLPEQEDYQGFHEEDDEDSSWINLDQSGDPEAQSKEFEDNLSANEFNGAKHFLHNNDPEVALSTFESLLLIHPTSIAAIYGRARALELLAERTNDYSAVQRSIDTHEELILTMDTDLEDTIFKEISSTCLFRLRSLGLYKRATSIYAACVERNPGNPELRVNMAINYLYQDKLISAKRILHEILLSWPKYGLALIYYGFVLVQLQDYKAAVEYFILGMGLSEDPCQDGRIYQAWGEALQRLNKKEEAMQVFEEGALMNLFPSAYQRSMYNVIGLRAQPFWTTKDTGAEEKLELLKQNWRTIREEGLGILNGNGQFTLESEKLLHSGHWKQYLLYSRGRKITSNCLRTPLTCQLIEMIPEARCTRGQVKFSVLDPGTHIYPHCGPTNSRLRAHLALQAEEQLTFIRVANETRSWKQGELLIFDDSFEHEIWHNGTIQRLILIVDLWNPDLDEYQRKNLPPI